MADWLRCMLPPLQHRMLISIPLSRLAGALTKEEYEARQEELQGRPVVCYCTLGYRSSDYAQQLKREGVEAQNLAGSIVAWVSWAGLGACVPRWILEWESGLWARRFPYRRAPCCCVLYTVFSACALPCRHTRGTRS